MEPAPYGGFMTRTIDEEKQQQEKLKEQQVEVVVNGTTETLRPEAIHFRGVDNLSTDDIKFFIDYYLNYREEDGDYVANDKIVWFRIRWIDDSNVNAIFKTHEDAILALNALSISAGPNSVEQKSDFSQEYVSSIVQERRGHTVLPLLSTDCKRKRSENRTCLARRKNKLKRKRSNRTTWRRTIVQSFCTQDNRSSWTEKLKMLEPTRDTICSMESQIEAGPVSLATKDGANI